MWWRALLVGGLFAGLLSACAVVDPVDSRFDTVTRSLARARDEAIFLNLIRASQNYPLQFATIANVTPTMTNTTSLGLPSFLEGPGFAGILKGATASTTTFPTSSPFRDVLFGNTTASNATAIGTNFNVSSQETGSFYTGFLKPIDLTILDYFIRQGYPRELLFWLFTESFEYKLPGQRPLGYHYTPPNDLGCDPADKKRRCFVDWVHNATFSGLTVEEKTQERASSPGGGGGNSKPTTFTYARFCFNYVLAKEALALAPQLAGQFKNDVDVTNEEVFGGPLACGSPTWHPETTATDPQQDILPLTFRNNTIQFRIIPRSAYGVFSFLGRLMKLQREGYEPAPYPPIDPRHYPAIRKDAGNIPPLLATLENHRLIDVVQDYDGKCFVHTWFEDGQYCVPNNANTTKQIFGLLSQLIAIQTAAADLSITPIVRVIQ
ncbi:MAG: hypothetical protein WAV27_10005 [Xanthobacteraceae bacterium]